MMDATAEDARLRRELAGLDSGPAGPATPGESPAVERLKARLAGVIAGARDRRMTDPERGEVEDLARDIEELRKKDGAAKKVDDGVGRRIDDERLRAEVAAAES
jgi:hypothetical protein